jgi:hypothetical protein
VAWAAVVEASNVPDSLSLASSNASWLASAAMETVLVEDLSFLIDASNSAVSDWWEAFLSLQVLVLLCIRLS